MELNIDPLLLIVIIILFFVAIKHIKSECKKKNIQPSEGLYEEDLVGLPDVDGIQGSPTITVIFSHETENSEDLSKELADMYINQRTFFYTGKGVQYNKKSLLSEKDIDIYIDYEKVNWDILKKIEV